MDSEYVWRITVRDFVAVGLTHGNGVTERISVERKSLTDDSVMN